MLPEVMTLLGDPEVEVRATSKVIADRLGHTCVRTVLDIYGHVHEGADEAAAAPR